MKQQKQQGACEDNQHQRFPHGFFSFFVSVSFPSVVAPELELGSYLPRPNLRRLPPIKSEERFFLPIDTRIGAGRSIIVILLSGMVDVPPMVVAPHPRSISKP